MSLYSDTRIVNATVAQVAEMVRAQKKVRDLLELKNIDEAIVKNSFASFTSAVLGLVFYTNVVGAVALGFISLISSLNAAEKTWLKDDVQKGYEQLLETHFYMTDAKWVKTNMTLTENRERIGYDFAFIKSRRTNSYTDAKGITIMQ